MTTIYFIRHGEKQSNIGNPRLTKVGIKQAQQTGQYLSQFPINKIIASPSKRTIETAQYIAEKLGFSYTTNPALVERMNWNDQSISRHEFISEWIASTHNRDYQPKWGESSYATGKRVAQFLTTLDLKKSQQIVIVSHGGAIVDYLRNYFKDDMFVPLHKRYPEGIGFRLFNCSITSLEYHNQPQIKLLNFVDHLKNISE